MITGNGSAGVCIRESTTALPTKSPRIGFVLYELAFGGVERQAELLAKAALADGFQPIIFVLGPDGPARPRFEGVAAIQFLHCDLHSDADLFSKLQAAAHQADLDAAIIFSTARLAVLSAALKPFTTRQVVYVGNPVPLDWLTLMKHWWRAWRYPPLPSLTLLGCSRHTLQSLQRDVYLRRFRVSMSWNCVAVPPSVVELRETCVPLRFGMVARLDRIKDQATLLHAAAVLRRRQMPAVLHLVGQGAEEPRLRRLAQKLSLDAEVVWEGTTEDVFGKMSQWDIFAFSTTADEGFGAAIAEGMALGLPCVLTDVGPCREVGDTAALYVPERSPEAWADVLTRLARDPQERRRRGAACRARVETCFRRERMWSEYRAALGYGSATA